MKKIFQILFKKPSIYLLTTALYLAFTAFFKWPAFAHSIPWYALGVILGIYFLDFAEAFFHIVPSPFRSVVFQTAFGIVSLFIVTSSASYLAKGLVLSLYLQIAILQIGEWKVMKSLSGWYRMISPPVPTRVQLWGLVVYLAVFIIETFLFIRS